MDNVALRINAVYVVIFEERSIALTIMFPC